jgi:hypothetical protein
LRHAPNDLHGSSEIARWLRVALVRHASVRTDEIHHRIGKLPLLGSEAVDAGDVIVSGKPKKARGAAVAQHHGVGGLKAGAAM